MTTQDIFFYEQTLPHRKIPVLRIGAYDDTYKGILLVRQNESFPTCIRVLSETDISRGWKGLSIRWIDAAKYFSQLENVAIFHAGLASKLLLDLHKEWKTQQTLRGLLAPFSLADGIWIPPQADIELTEKKYAYYSMPRPVASLFAMIIE